jgi:membrane-associated phospholipid phosphatase
MNTEDAEAKATTATADEAPMRDPVRRSAVRRLWRAETAYVVMLAGFGVLALFAHFDPYFNWDLIISRGLQSLNSPGFFDFMRAVSIFGNTWIPWALTVIGVILFFIFRKRSEAAGLALSAGGGALLNSLLKMLIGRPRPTAELVMVYRELRTESFPSGHVNFYVCFFGFLLFVAFALLPPGSLARRAAITLMALPIALIGVSRIYLGAHWPSDTLGAYLVSGVWLAFSLHLYRGWKQRATLHPEIAK